MTASAGTVARRLSLIERTIGGDKRRGWCLAHPRAHRLPIDLDGREGRQDLVLPERVRGNRLVAAQEGMTDPAGPLLRVVQRYPAVPRWLAGTAATSRRPGFLSPFVQGSDRVVHPRFELLESPTSRNDHLMFSRAGHYLQLDESDASPRSSCGCCPPPRSLP